MFDMMRSSLEFDMSSVAGLIVPGRQPGNPDDAHQILGGCSAYTDARDTHKDA
jgi:hypothetical protein